MFKWLHHLFNPHCPDCRLEKECNTCDTLRSILEQERFEKKQLLEQLMNLTKPEVIIHESSEGEKKPIRPSYTPWRVKQQLLEQEDRAKAKILKEKEEESKISIAIPKVSVEKLEEEIGIGDSNAS